MDEKTLCCVWYDEQGKKKKTFRIIKDYRDFFINSLVENDQTVVLLSDGRFTDKILLANKNPKIAKAAVLHSNHLQFPYEYGSPLVDRNKSLLNNINQLDALVTLTERQATDIRNRFGRISTIHTIGHPTFPLQSDRFASETNVAVIAARYSGIKQIPHAIKAFKKVTKKFLKSSWRFGALVKKKKNTGNSSKN